MYSYRALELTPQIIISTLHTIYDSVQSQLISSKHFPIEVRLRRWNRRRYRNFLGIFLKKLQFFKNLKFIFLFIFIEILYKYL